MILKSESSLLLGKELAACWCKDLLYLSVYLKLKEKRKSVPFTVREVPVSLSVYFFLQCKPEKPDNNRVGNVPNLTLK